MDSSTLIYLGILALAPCIAIMVYIYWKDKFDKEPLKVLIITFLLGALSALPVVVSGHFLESLGFDPFSKSIIWSFISMFCVVGIIEEGFKFLAVYLYAHRHHAFNEPFDGITYGVMSAMGFASLENLLYVFGNEQMCCHRFVLSTLSVFVFYLQMCLVKRNLNVTNHLLCFVVQ